MVSIRKIGKGYQYYFDIAPQDGKRKRVSKSGFKTKAEAKKEGIIAYNDYLNTGKTISRDGNISYSDYLDYWLDNYCKINLKYHTIQSYTNIINNHIKPNLGYYKLSQLDTKSLQNFINQIYVEKSFSKSFLHNILKVIKGSFKYACKTAGFIKYNPATEVNLPKYDTPPNDPAHIFSEKEIETILRRFENNHAVYYAMLTAYYTGLRISEVFALTWEDIDLKKKTISVNKIIMEKNHTGTTHCRHLSGNSTTVWYFGTCKTQSSYRTITIGDTLVNALKDYRREQEENEKYYNNSYMKHYLVETQNYYNNKPEYKILNAVKEIPVALKEVKLVFIKDNGVFEGTATTKYPFKVIHYELGINCRFHDFRDTHATRLIENGVDVKAVAKRLGHSNIRTTYEIYVRVTDKMERETANVFEEFSNLKLK